VKGFSAKAKPLNWEEAQTACQMIDSHLVTIADEDENGIADDFFDLGGISATDAWIGLTDQYGEGTFLWIEAVGEFRAPVFTAWDTDTEPAQPDNDPDDNADCAVFQSSDAQWSDDDCEESRAYICEHTWR
jgi:hypothetical protein